MILAVGIALAAYLGVPAAHGATVAIRPSSDPLALASRGAVGLFVPGSGATISRGETTRALERAPAGRCRPCDFTIYLRLPPPGEHHNVERYPIAIVGHGYRGLLVSGRTRIDGLVSVFDIAPTVRALRRGEQPPIRSRPDAHARATLAALDRRLARAHDSRLPALLVVVFSTIGLAFVAIWRRSAYLGRATALMIPAALALSLGLSALGIRGAAVVAVTLAAALPIALAGAAALRGGSLGLLLVGLLAAFAVVLAVWPEVNSLSSLGPHPDGGGRFYGVTNQVETLLLAPVLLAATLLAPRWLAGVALLALVTVGWSRTGADGGGIVVFLAALALLAARRLGVRLTGARIALAAAGGVLAALALVGIDAALGGSSHVTRAVGRPGGLPGDLGHRLAVSADAATRSWFIIVLTAFFIASLCWFALRRRRPPALEAILVAVAVSLVVNDSSVDVVGFGALACLVVWAARPAL